MKARFIVALIVALSFIGGNLFAAQATNKDNSGKAKTMKVAHAKRHHVKRVRHHRVKKTSMMKKSSAPSKSKAMK
jgi:Ni/Co efflux regulator RcnB